MSNINDTYNNTLQSKSASPELFHGKQLTVVQEDNSRLNIAEMNANKATLQSYPRRIVFELTNSCNLSCVMCGRNYTEFSPAALTINQFLWFKDLFRAIEEVTLIGWGEPTIHPNFVEILKILDQYPVRKYFCTNGMRLDELEDAIFEYHVDLIGVSISGTSIETNNKLRNRGDLDKIVNCIKSIIARKKTVGNQWPRLSFIYCLMKSNLHELLPCIKLAHQLGVNRVKIVYFTAFTKALFNESVWGMEQEIHQIFEEATELATRLDIELTLPPIRGQDSVGTAPHHKCCLSWRDLFVGADGQIRPCTSTSEILGTIDMNKTFFDLWNSKEFVLHRRNVNQTDNMSRSCTDCYQESICNWNLKKSFLQDGNAYAPMWGESKTGVTCLKGF